MVPTLTIRGISDTGLVGSLKRLAIGPQVEIALAEGRRPLPGRHAPMARVAIAVGDAVRKEFPEGWYEGKVTEIRVIRRRQGHNPTLRYRVLYADSDSEEMNYSELMAVRVGAPGASDEPTSASSPPATPAPRPPAATATPVAAATHRSAVPKRIDAQLRKEVRLFAATLGGKPVTALACETGAQRRVFVDARWDAAKLWGPHGQ